MYTRYSKFLHIIHLSGDLMLLNLAYSLGHYLRFDHLMRMNEQQYIQLLMFINLLWFFVSYITRLYNIYRVTKIEKVFSSLFQAVLLHSVFLFAFIFMIKGHYYSREQLLYMYLIFVGGLFTWRFGFLYFLRLLRSSGFNFRRIVILGAGPVGLQFFNQINAHDEYGYKLLGFFDDSPSQDSPVKDLVVGGLEDAKAFILENKVDEIYCALPPSAADKIKSYLQFSDDHMIRFKMVPDFRGFINKQVKVDFYGFMPVLTIRNEPLENLYNRAIKRVFDFSFSFLVILLVFSWLFPLIALLIKLTSKGPVLFKQKRSGLRNQEFWCYKFRTMYVNDQADSLQATANDPRVTPIGRFLRKTNLDELPQFFNVLLGNMSVVGPRPHMLKHTREYSKIIDKFMVRHLVKPGITGLAQVKGFRGETRDTMQMRKRVMADVWYLENWSLFLDFKIILLTVWNMLKGEENAV